jgi:hypothetical protein
VSPTSLTTYLNKYSDTKAIATTETAGDVPVFSSFPSFGGCPNGRCPNAR